MTLTTSLATGLTIILLSLALQLKRRAWRKEHLKGLELRPNCLLTRYPIAFISGRRSLFRLFSHWNQIPVYLREHGYEVLVIEPLRGKKRRDSITSALQSLNEKCHVIGDSSVEDDLTIIARAKLANIVSITLVRNGASAQNKPQMHRAISISDLKPLHSAIEVFDIAPVANEIARELYLNRISLLLLLAHNALSFFKRRVDPLETGELIGRAGWDLEARFLDLAISLAERDAQWSD